MVEMTLEDSPLTISEHLGELRRRLVAILIILCVACAAAYPWTSAAITWLAHPLGQLIFSRPMEAFDTRLKISFYFGLAASFPFWLREVWVFAGPALGAGARQLLLRTVPAAYLLFFLGVALALFVVLPPATNFFLSFGNDSVKPLISIAEYVDFALRMAVSFGLAFQLPLAMMTLGRLGLASRQSLASWRRGVYFTAFVAGAVLTSPEVFTQICLAVPLIVLFELGLRLMPAGLST